MVNCALRSLYARKDIQVPVVSRAGGPPRTGLGAMRENCLDKHESNLDISLVQPVAYSLYVHLESDAHASSAARTGDFTQVNAWFRSQWTHTVRTKRYDSKQDLSDFKKSTNKDIGTFVEGSSRSLV